LIYGTQLSTDIRYKQRPSAAPPPCV
jgi:hypothetical protein